ncbi:transposon TX1, partial [Tanacetum coccineum]
SDDGRKFSKLDRFLLNDKFKEQWVNLANLAVVAIDRKLSDHCPIFLKDMDLDFGPKPFRFFDTWLEEKDIGQVVAGAWEKEVRSSRPDCRFRDKLKNVKMEVKMWSRKRFGVFTENIVEHRKEAMRANVSMLRQKARVRWDVEGDENSKKFHSVVGRRNNKNCIRGLMLEVGFGENEVWEAIYGCGGEKAPDPEVRWFWEKTKITRGCNASFITVIPKVADPIGLGDYRPISLIGCYYKIIAKMLVERVKKVVGDVVGDAQTAFIKGRFILDGVLVANETMEFIRKTKAKGLIFKVDFEKTSPTMEFGSERSVRQGDPLFPFLFILAAEGLNAIVNEAVTKEWDKDNARALMCILKCFEEVSGLKVNFNKSKVYSVGVNSNEIAEMVRWMGCIMGEFPFTYLGLPIRESMRRSSAWRPVGGRGLGLGGRDVWCDIVKVGSDIDEVGIDFTSSFMCKLGNGRDISIWEDRDIWRWSLHDSGNFSVKVLTRMIEEKTLALDSSRQETMWNKLVPKKAVVPGFLWQSEVSFGAFFLLSAVLFYYCSLRSSIVTILLLKVYDSFWL